MADPFLAPPPNKNSPAGITQLKELLAEQGYWKYDITGTWGTRLTHAVTYFQQTHIGEDGKQLKGDAKVGDKTWWALRNPHGAPQRSNLAPSIPQGLLGTERAVVLAKALAEHAKGVKEVPGGSNRGPEVDKYFPSWLLKKWPTKTTKGEAWCAFFVNWVVTQALGSRPWGGYIGSCYTLWKTSRSKGLPIYSGGANLCPGDAFLLFKTDPDKGRPKGGHIGLVLRVSEDGSQINTVEGNCGNRVAVKLRSTSDISRFVNFYGDKGHSVDFERGLVDATDVSGSGTR